MQALQNELTELKARAVELQQQIIVQPDRDVLRLELIALRNQITELQKKENILLGQIQGKFLFLRGEFYFLLEFVYFLWP
jgi:FtsZ-binding cell division protein ZapB